MLRKTLVAALLTAFFSCGDDSDDSKAEDTAVATAIENPTFQQANAIMITSCGGAACHSSGSSLQVYVDNESLVTQRSTLITTEIEARRMPKNRSISDADRTTLLNYLSGL
jgi:hypothetical protein